jgi:hypothetical protein
VCLSFGANGERYCLGHLTGTNDAKPFTEVIFGLKDQYLSHHVLWLYSVKSSFAKEAHHNINVLLLVTYLLRTSLRHIHLGIMNALH